METLGTGIAAAFAQLGPLGLFIAYLVWRELAVQKERNKVDQERAESDKALASALSALTVTIQHLDNRIR